MHQINGLTFEMNRVDEQIPLGQVERWVFSNDSAPCRISGASYGTHFRWNRGRPAGIFRTRLAGRTRCW